MNKTIAAIFAILFLTFVVTAQNAGVAAPTAGVSVQSGQIAWEKDYKKALAMAKETNKPLLLDFSAEWCKPCRMMEEEFWVMPDVIEAVKPFIAVKVNYDSETGLVKKYGVAAIPFVVFADPLGNMIAARRGFSSRKVAELNQIFEEMPKDFSALKEFYDALELKKDDGLALLKIADAYRGAKMVRLSNDFYKKALKTPEIQSDIEKKERTMTALGVNSYNLGDFEQAVENMEDYLKEFPNGKNKDLAVAVLAIGNASRGKLKEANKYLEILKAEFPASKNIAMATNAIEKAKNKKGNN